MAENDKNNRRNYEKLGRAVTSWFELPKDLVLDLPKITMIGRSEIAVENHRGIIQCSEACMRINLARGYLEIQGQDLQIHSLCAEEIQFTGQINQILFLE